MNEYLEKIFIDKNQNEQRRMIAQICESSPMFDLIVRKIRNRQLYDDNGHLLYDFATQDYLGLGFRPDLLNAVSEGAGKYGINVPWCRLVGTFDIFNQVENRIADLVGSEACNVFASTTLLNHGVIPALLGRNGVLFLDKSGHMTMYEAAKITRDSGSTLVSFPSNDLSALEDLLIEYKDTEKKLICIDGVNSMTGNYSNLPGLDALAEQYNALLYVDDAHGFGVVGENPGDEAPYGYKGNGLVNYFNLDFSHILYIGCFSKAYGSYGSFIACSQRMRTFLISQVTSHDLGGTAPASAMSAVLAGLDINENSGERIRKKIWTLTHQAMNGLRELGFEIDNKTGFPIISVKIKKGSVIVDLSKLLYENNIFLTLSPYPMVKRGKEALRITLTATNTEAEVRQLIKAFSIIKDIYGY